MNILIVDDDEFNRECLSVFFKSSDHVIYEAAGGDEALQLVTKRNIQLVVSDVKMPGMSGYELLDEIKIMCPETAVVMMTGYGDIKDAVSAMKNGAFDYLLKPINVEELMVIIEKLQSYLNLKQQNKTLKKETNKLKVGLENLAKESVFKGMGIFSAEMKKVIRVADKFHNKKDIAVLIEGATGSGKEVLAKYIHYGRNIDNIEPFIAVNCASISPTLFENELFGYEAGAFTGANVKGQAGKFELAAAGTILLDEISEIPVEYQAKLLRVIQEREFYRVGGLKKIKLKARIIAASNQNLKQQVDNGLFRKDLFYRFNVGYIQIPTLKERKGALIKLALLFLEQLHDKKRSTFKTISLEARNLMMQ